MDEPTPRRGARSPVSHDHRHEAVPDPSHPEYRDVHHREREPDLSPDFEAVLRLVRDQTEERLVELGLARPAEASEPEREPEAGREAPRPHAGPAGPDDVEAIGPIAPPAPGLPEAGGDWPR